MTPKLFYILLAVFVGVILSIIANLFTNNKDVNQWLATKGIGAKRLFWGMLLATVSLAVIAYLQYQSDQETKPLSDTNNSITSLTPMPRMTPTITSKTPEPNTPTPIPPTTPTPIITPIPETPTPVMPPVTAHEIKFGQTLSNQFVPQFEPNVEYYFEVDPAHVNKEVTITVTPEAGFEINILLLNSRRDAFRPKDRSNDEYKIASFSPKFIGTYYIKIEPRKSNGRFNIFLE